MTEVLFIRIPKNASTSMYEALKEVNIIERRKEVFFDKVLRSEYCQGIYDPTHLTLEMAIHYLGEEILDLPSLCVIRDPLARIVSAYEFAKAKGIFKYHGKQTMSFKAFCHHYCLNKENKYLFHFHSQKKFISYQGVPRIHWIIDINEIEYDFSAFKITFGLDSLPDLQLLNATEHKPYMEYYDKFDKDLVLSTYEEDYKEFSIKSGE